MAYRAQVLVDNEWTGNGLRFATAPEAERYAADLQRRWTLVRDWRVQETTGNANCAFPYKGQLTQLEE
jgi:hypothetical protein|tara:strand:+ start:248 stop:451 length:204 start_codon:yes stop_codon:yes gene_type:complete